MTYVEMLDTLCRRAGSERKASVEVGISQASFNAWRRDRSYPDDEQGRRIAELLQLDPAYVLAVIHAARAKTNETRALWTRIATQFKDAAMIGAVVIGAGIVPAPAEAAPSGAQRAPSAPCVLCKVRRCRCNPGFLGRSFASVLHANA